MINLDILKRIKKLNGYYASKVVWRGELCVLQNFDAHWRMVAKHYGKDEHEFLNKFTDVEELNINVIEQYYFECFDRNFRSECDLYIFDKLKNESGIYLLYDINGNISYIGQSKNLGNRMYQSLIQKNPYTNSVSFSFFFVPKESLEKVEAIGINFFEPILNNHYPEFEFNKKEYLKVIKSYSEARRVSYFLNFNVILEDLL